MVLKMMAFAMEIFGLIVSIMIGDRLTSLIFIAAMLVVMCIAIEDIKKYLD